MFKYKITKILEGVSQSEDEFNKLGAEGWQLIQVYEMWVFWCKLDIRGDAFLKSVAEGIGDLVKDLEDDKKI